MARVSKRSLRMIERALSEHGLILKYASWEPLGPCMEMCGPEGGWYVVALEPLDGREFVFLGYSLCGWVSVLGGIARTWSRSEEVTWIERQADLRLWNE